MINIFKKILTILNQAQKTKILFVVFCTIFISIFETAGIGLLAYFVSLLTDMDQVISKFPNKELQFYLSNLEPSQIIVMFLIAIISFFIFKNLFIFFFHYITYKIKFSTHLSLVNKLLIKYLHQNYNFFLINDKSKIINYVKEETSRLNNVIFSAIYIVKEIFLILFILIGILLVNFGKSFLIIIPMTVFSYFLYKIFKNILKLYGKKQTEYTNLLYKNLYESFDGIRLLKLRNLEKIFLSKIINNYQNLFGVMFKSSYIVPIPRLILEILGVSTLCFIIYFHFLTNNTLQTILPSITFITLGIIRLIPSISALNNSINTFIHHSVSVENIYQVLNNPKNEFQKEINPDHQKKIKRNDIKISSLKLENINFKYFNSARYALSDINIEIKKNEIIGVIGKSGSGKSTLTDIITGLIKPSSGKILINNDQELKYYELSDKIGYVPQNNFILDDDIRKNITLEKYSEINEQEYQKSLNAVYLSENELNSRNLGDSGLKISGGQKQRIGISRVLYQNPDLIVLDEATSSIDIETEKKIMKNIYDIKSEKIIIIVAHRLATLGKCDKLVILEDGHIKDIGLKKDILDKYDYLKEYIKSEDFTN